MNKRFNLGPTGSCLCPSCKFETPKQQNVMCTMLVCTKCGTPMVRHPRDVIIDLDGCADELDNNGLNAFATELDKVVASMYNDVLNITDSDISRELNSLKIYIPGLLV